MTTDKEIKNYINSIKKLFPIYSKKNVNMLKTWKKTSTNMFMRTNLPQ